MGKPGPSHRHTSGNSERAGIGHSPSASGNIATSFGLGNLKCVLRDRQTRGFNWDVPVKGIGMKHGVQISFAMESPALANFTERTGVKNGFN